VRVVNRLDANVVERERLFTFGQRLVDYHLFCSFAFFLFLFCFVLFFFFYENEILMKTVDLHIEVGTYSYNINTIVSRCTVRYIVLPRTKLSLISNQNSTLKKLGCMEKLDGSIFSKIVFIIFGPMN